MRQPRWKNLLSYVTEMHIESAPSEYNPHLYVSLYRGRYQLATANAVYSFEDLYANFSLSFEQIDLDALPIQRVLVLGFGLGSIPLILEKTFQKNYEYVVVEIDESVLYLANKYALPELQSPIELICADAFPYVMQCQEKFDMIAMDVFLDDVIPSQFEQSDFLERLSELLTPNGLLLYNRLAHNSDDIMKTHTFYKDHFQPFFKDGTYLNVKGNWMLLNRKDVLKK